MIEIGIIRNRNELEQAYNLWTKVFPNERSFFEKRLNNDPNYSIDTTWVARVKDKIVASVQVFPIDVRVGHVQVTLGGIGNVATLQEYRAWSCSDTAKKINPLDGTSRV